MLSSLQVYLDFSGYTDIAIGIAALKGFKLPVNFNSPYKASSLSGFWHRWHISLSGWLKDYLYIPLGGNRERDFWLLCYDRSNMCFCCSTFWRGMVAWGICSGSYFYDYILCSIP